MDRVFSKLPAHPLNPLKWAFGVICLALTLGVVGVTCAWANLTINIHLGSQTVMVRTQGGTVAEALKKAKVSLRKEDVVSPTLNTPLKEGMQIYVDKAAKVTIYHDGKQQSIWTRKKTVREVLGAAGVSVGKLDWVTPGLDGQAGSKIAITRVQEKQLVEVFTVPFKVETRADNSLLRGMRKVITKGVPGQSKRLVRMVYTNGKLALKTVLQTIVIKPPQNQVFAVGTVRTVSRGGQPLNFRDSMLMEASGYSHTGYRTSTGRIPVRGVAAVDPRVIPMGTKVYVDGYGYAVAADRGSAIIGQHIDLFFDTEREAVRWGRKMVRVYILEE